MKEYISKYGTVSAENAFDIIKNYSGTVYAVYSDHFLCSENTDCDISHLMELRIFSEESEFRIFRYDLGSDFFWRYIDDTSFRQALSQEDDEFLKDFNNRIFDEIHLLDCDREKSHGYSYFTRAGAEYSLPAENAEKIMIRNYLDYDKNGMLSVNDFRIVKIL